MAIRTIDYKNVDLTEDEWAEYQKLVKAYTKANNKGEDYFRGLFETDEEGKIIFIRSLGNRFTTMEIIFFVINIMQNQHIRFMYKTLNNKILEINNKLLEVDKKLEELNKNKTVE